MMHACAQCAGFCCLHSTLCNTRFKACRLCAIICPVIHQSCTVLRLATLIFCSQQLSHTWQPCSHHAALYCLALDNPGFVQLSAVSCLATLVLCSCQLSHAWQTWFCAVIGCLTLCNHTFLQSSCSPVLSCAWQPWFCSVVSCSHWATLVLCSCQLSHAWQPWCCVGSMQLSAVLCLATLVLCSHHAVVSCLTPGNPGFVQSSCSCQLSHAWHPCFFAGGAPGDGEQQRNPEASPEHHLLHGSQC